MIRASSLFWLCVALLAAFPARAADGVREINQACALVGCFSGDAPGFPVEIGPLSTGSYRLTGNLILGFGDPVAITIAAPGATLDLGGFGIRGLNACTGTTGVVTCSNPGLGVAIIASAPGVTVRNGVVQGVPGNGIDLASHSRVESVRLSDIGGVAIRVGSHSLILSCQVWEVGASALTGATGAESILAAGNTVSVVGGQTMTLGIVESGGNSCDDGRCSAVPTRRYYLTTDTFDGSQALTACAPGFHMASFHELAEPGALRYDTDRGMTSADSGSGPPISFVIAQDGWIRGAPSSIVGSNSCSQWTSSEGSGQTGTFQPLGGDVDPGVSDCDQNERVWCIQD